MLLVSGNLRAVASWRFIPECAHADRSTVITGMAIHTLHCRQSIPVGRDEAWQFFSNPRNLARITPRSLDFQIVTPDLPAAIHSGMMIQYRVRPLLGIPMKWLTEITHVEEGRYFVDEQRVGPYAIWHHEHHFHDMGPGQTDIEDRVTYRLPFGWLSEPVHALVVKRQLQEIFSFRRVAVDEIFGLKTAIAVPAPGAEKNFASPVSESFAHT